MGGETGSHTNQLSNEAVLAQIKVLQANLAKFNADPEFFQDLMGMQGFDRKYHSYIEELEMESLRDLEAGQAHQRADQERNEVH